MRSRNERCSRRSDGNLTIDGRLRSREWERELSIFRNLRFISGRWVEKAGQRRRRYYQLTAQGKTVLKEQRSSWAEFVNAIDRITGGEHA